MGEWSLQEISLVWVGAVEQVGGRYVRGRVRELEGEWIESGNEDKDEEMI